MKIAIRLKDPDFYNTFYGILEMLKKSERWNGGFFYSKEVLCKVINVLFYGAYLLYQDNNDCKKENFEESYESTSRCYVPLKPSDIFIDEEIKEHISKFPHDELLVLNKNNIYIG